MNVELIVATTLVVATFVAVVAARARLERVRLDAYHRGRADGADTVNAYWRRQQSWEDLGAAERPRMPSVKEAGSGPP